MANTSLITTAYSTRLLEQFKANLVFSNLINGGWQQDAQFNKNVLINAVSAPTIGSYTGADIDIAPVTSSALTLTIDQASYWSQEIDALVSGQSTVSAQVLTQMIDLGAYATALTVDRYIAATIVSGASATNLVASASISSASDAYDYIVEMGVKLDEADAPAIERYVVVSPDFAGLLLKDNRVVNNTTALTNGLVTTINGMSIFKSNNLPKTGNYTNILAGVKYASAYAYNIQELEVFTQEKRFNKAVKSLFVYGAKIVKPTGLSVFPVIVS